MKNTLILAGLGAFGVAAAFVAGPALAATPADNGATSPVRYGYERMLETKATVLNMDKEQLRTQLQDKTMLQVAEEKGVTQEQLQTAMQANGAGLNADHQANCDGTPGDAHQYGRQ